MKVKWDYCSQYMGKYIKRSKPPTSCCFTTAVQFSEARSFFFGAPWRKRCMLGRQENEMRLMDADGIDLFNGMFQTDKEKMAEIKIWGFR